MIISFLKDLSRDYESLLENGNFSDVVIRVGGEFNHIKEFRAHSMVLRARSSYFRIALSDNWAKRVENVIVFEKPNIHPKEFEVIIKYMYSGIFKLNSEDLRFVVNILVAADELGLSELFDCIQEYLILTMENSLLQNFGLIHKIASQHESFKRLQKFCANAITYLPYTIFQAEDFDFLGQDALISLLKHEDLPIEEGEVWDIIIRWGMAQIPTLPSAITDWTSSDFEELENILKPCISLIKFEHISPDDFILKVEPFRKIMDRNLYDRILEYHFLANSRPRSSNMKHRGVDSLLIGLRHVVHFANWIDNNTTYTTETSPYKFDLLLRGTKDGFTPKKFHSKCDYEGSTLIIVRIKNTNELLGGYNPLDWKSDNTYGQTNKSFIFNLNYNDPSMSIVSRPIASNPIGNNEVYGPCFRIDLYLDYYEFTKKCKCSCSQLHYSKPILKNNGPAIAEVEEYEVFKVMRKKDAYIF
ncbi:6703_t:CDS:2 [Acaulospora colombiana]|uniref:6703_t:CDS:1 n=1 Tax=Acaulospora colombiana TaxID=27376 RepID=A0ACA9KFS4_9GLOM|nr:6703_t:CDS:2 [Acaulospora colombiana]